jgi:hypothetical protein
MVSMDVIDEPDLTPWDEYFEYFNNRIIISINANPKGTVALI